MNTLIVWCLFYRILSTVASSSSSSPTSSNNRIDLYKIEGKIDFSDEKNSLEDIRILVDEGQYIGIPRADGSFVISGVPSGSYVVSVNSPFHIFEPIGVDINTKGKIHARAVDFIQPGKVVSREYPLHFKVHGHPNYFQERTTYHLVDIVLHPAVLSIIVPAVLFYFLTKLTLPMEDMQEVFQQMNDNVQLYRNVPDLTDWLIRHFGPRRQRPERQPSTDDDSIRPANTRKEVSKRKSNKKHQISDCIFSFGSFSFHKKPGLYC